jgi:hypothetical protein
MDGVVPSGRGESLGITCFDVQGIGRVNLINAAFRAGELGVDASIQAMPRDQRAGFSNLLTVEAERVDPASGASTTFSVSGSLIGERAVIVKMDDLETFPAFEPTSNVLFFRNQDKPGSIAGVLDILAAANIK